MKRSKSLMLRLMVGTAGLAMLAGCDEEPKAEGHTYANAEACVTAGEYSAEQCEKSFEAARNAHLIGGPRYEAEDLCEEEWGDDDCDRVSSGGSFIYMPRMHSYAMTRAIRLPASGQAPAMTPAAAAAPVQAQPLYRTMNGDRTTMDGSFVRTATGSKIVLPQAVASAAPKAMPVMTRSSIAASGGFGARASSGG